MNVIGVGYQGKTQDQMCKSLLASGVDVLCDVRLTPLSRKPGLSKNSLKGAVNDIGIEYLHLPELGNPKWNRAGFGGNDHELAAARNSFRQLVLGEPAARSALQQLREISGTGRTAALLCFEADPSRCHRSVVLDELFAISVLVG